MVLAADNFTFTAHLIGAIGGRVRSRPIRCVRAWYGRTCCENRAAESLLLALVGKMPPSLPDRDAPGRCFGVPVWRGTYYTRDTQRQRAERKG